MYGSYIVQLNFDIAKPRYSEHLDLTNWSPLPLVLLYQKLFCKSSLYYEPKVYISEQTLGTVWYVRENLPNVFLIFDLTNSRYHELFSILLRSSFIEILLC